VKVRVRVSPDIVVQTTVPERISDNEWRTVRTISERLHEVETLAQEIWLLDSRIARFEGASEPVRLDCDSRFLGAPVLRLILGVLQELLINANTDPALEQSINHLKKKLSQIAYEDSETLIPVHAHGQDHLLPSDQADSLQKALSDELESVSPLVNYLVLVCFTGLQVQTDDCVQAHSKRHTVVARVDELHNRAFLSALGIAELVS